MLALKDRVNRAAPETDYDCGLGFEAEGGCNDEFGEATVCLPNACFIKTGGCDWHVLLTETASLPQATRLETPRCFTTREEACGCLGCCDGTEMTSTIDSQPTLLQCGFVAR